MTKEQQDRYGKVLTAAMQCHNGAECAIGFIRYEALRKLNARQFAELSRRNLAGEAFDDLVDGLISREVSH